MSTRNRAVDRALVFCLFTIVIAPEARAQALDSTARVTPGTCPVLHCNLGMWQADVALPVFAAPGAARPAFALQPRVPFEALRGETHAIPGVHVLRTRLEVLSDGATALLAPGDTIRTLAYVGDGRFALEAGGRAWVAVMDERDAARFQTVRPRRETWWVEVKAPHGRRGWIEGGDARVAGQSLDEAMQPLTSPVLDSAFLAGLTGPVAAVVQERAAATLTAFDPSLEGAQDAQGVVWWNADRLRMLHVRFRSLLTASATTDPEQSGLPPTLAICCGNLLYHRLAVFTRREPEYVATVTVPDQGERHVVEAFFDENGRMVRLRRDARNVTIGYADSVMGRAWYAAARAQVQEVASRAAAAAAARPRPTADPGRRSMRARASALAGNPLVRLGGAAALIALAALAAWQWWRRRAKAPPGGKPSSAEGAAEHQDAPPPEEGWVCPYCHADVLLDLDSCWLCERPRPTEPPRPAAAVTVCACGEPAPAGARSCQRCGKSFRRAF